MVKMVNWWRIRGGEGNGVNEGWIVRLSVWWWFDWGMELRIWKGLVGLVKRSGERVRSS